MEKYEFNQSYLSTLLEIFGIFAQSEVGTNNRKTKFFHQILLQKCKCFFDTSVDVVDFLVTEKTDRDF